MYLGYLMEWILKIKLTRISTLNSHLELKQFENNKNLASQVLLIIIVSLLRSVTII